MRGHRASRLTTACGPIRPALWGGARGAPAASAGLADGRASPLARLPAGPRRSRATRARCLLELSNRQGNHGEDVKELYYYLDAVPAYSYARMLYKYPQAEFPYARLVQENARRGRQDPEFEIIDTGVFDADRYFDVDIEYAKA